MKKRDVQPSSGSFLASFSRREKDITSSFTCSGVINSLLPAGERPSPSAIPPAGASWDQEAIPPAGASWDQEGAALRAREGLGMRAARWLALATFYNSEIDIKSLKFFLFWKRSQVKFDGFKNKLDIIQDLFVTKAQNFQTSSFKPFGSGCIGVLSFNRIMGSTIEFNNQKLRMTVKVNSVIFKNFLTNKFTKLELSITQAIPQFCFSRSQISPTFLSNLFQNISGHSKILAMKSFSQREKVARSAG